AGKAVERQCESNRQWVTHLLRAVLGREDLAQTSGRVLRTSFVQNLLIQRQVVGRDDVRLEVAVQSALLRLPTIIVTCRVQWLRQVADEMAHQSGVKQGLVDELFLDVGDIAFATLAALGLSLARF